VINIKTKVMPDTCGKLREHIQINCEYCGKLFWKAYKVYKITKHHYCCQECSKQGSKERIKLNCLFCNKEFEKVKSKITKHNFCCRKCKDQAQRIESNIKTLQPSHYKNGECAYRDKAFNTYVHKCFNCGYDEYKEALEVHHIDGNRENNDVGNLMILCANCHTLVTRNIITLKYKSQ